MLGISRKDRGSAWGHSGVTGWGHSGLPPWMQGCCGVKPLTASEASCGNPVSSPAVLMSASSMGFVWESGWGMWGERAVSWLFPRERSSNVAVAVRLMQGCFPQCSSVSTCRLCVWQSTQRNNGMHELRGIQELSINAVQPQSKKLQLHKAALDKTVPSPGYKCAIPSVCVPC